MPKLLGVRETVHGAGQLPAFVRRAQQVSLMGIGQEPSLSSVMVLPVAAVLLAAGAIGWVIYRSGGS